MLKVGNISEILNDEVFIEQCKQRANIYKARGRSIEEIIKHTAQGEAIEVLMCDKFGWTHTPFNVKDHDAVTPDGEKVEIKHTVFDNKFWTFVPDKYEFFLDNAHKLDMIALCYLNADTNDVFLKFIANAKTFEEYSMKSRYNDSWFYKTDVAVHNKQCMVY